MRFLGIPVSMPLRIPLSLLVVLALQDQCKPCQSPWLWWSSFRLWVVGYYPPSQQVTGVAQLHFNLSWMCWDMVTPFALASANAFAKVLSSVLNPRWLFLGFSFFRKSVLLLFIVVYKICRLFYGVRFVRASSFLWCRIVSDSSFLGCWMCWMHGGEFWCLRGGNVSILEVLPLHQE